MCWTHDRCPWPFAEWLPCWQELTSVFKQDKTNGTSSPLCSLNQSFSIPTQSSNPMWDANTASWHCKGSDFITLSYRKTWLYGDYYLLHHFCLRQLFHPFFLIVFENKLICMANSAWCLQKHMSQLALVAFSLLQPRELESLIWHNVTSSCSDMFEKSIHANSQPKIGFNMVAYWPLLYEG